MSPFRTSPAALRSPRPHRPRTTSGSSPTVTSSSSLPVPPRICRPGSLTSRGASSTTTSSPRLSTARCAFSRGRASRHTRARRRDRPRSRQGGNGAGGDCDRLRLARAVARVDRDRFRLARRTAVGRGASEARGHSVRPGAALAAPVLVGNGTRRDLYAFLRTPYAGLLRSDVDFLEGRLRGRAVLRGDRTVEETTKLRNGRPLPIVDLVGQGEEPLEAARAAVLAMVRNAHGLGAPPVTEPAKRDLRAAEAANEVVGELERLRDAGVAIRADDVLSALDRATVRSHAAREPGRVAVLDLTRARTRSFEAVFIVGLEQGVLPRRTPTSPFLDDETRRALDGARGARLQRPETASRDRYCSTPLAPGPGACSSSSGRRRPTTDRRGSRARSGRRCVSSSTRRRAAAHHQAPTLPPDVADRVGADRTRAPSRVSRASQPATRAKPTHSRMRTAGSASSAGRGAPSRDPTALRHPRAVALLASRETFRVTDLERMAGCSSAWFIERYLRPGRSTRRSIRG